MPFRFHRRKNLGGRFWAGLSRSGPRVGRRGKRVSWSWGRRGPSVSVRLRKGLSWFWRR